MKMIALAREPHQPVTIFPQADLIPDSAITLPGRPLFLPDFAPEWEARIMVGVRISRLGKGMAAGFASRYYDAVTVMARICPLPAASYPGALSTAFDGCVQLGEWIAAPERLADGLDVSCGSLSLSLTRAELALDEAVAAVARYLTIRNGDIICPVTLPVRIPVAVGDTLTATLPGLIADASADAPCLRARLK